MPDRSIFLQVSPDAHFTPKDFAEVFLQLPAGCALVGGQAVAWWAERYRDKGLRPVTSQDIDFWGSREDLITVAKAMNRKPVFPHQYEMTIWVGAVPMEIKGHRTLAEFLHSVPGLDTHDPEAASVEQEIELAGQTKTLLVLTPVSLVFSKMHNLRHFDQTHRDDESHLKTCLAAVGPFLAELMDHKDFRLVFWNVRRLVDCAHMRPNRKLAGEHGVDILASVPVDAICAQAERNDLSDTDRDRIRRFCSEYWPRVQERLKQP